MKHLKPQSLLYSPSHCGPRPFLLLFSPSRSSHSLPAAPPPPPPHLRLQEEEARLVRVSVWWDFENCNIPAGDTAVFRVASSITAAVRANGIRGPVEITAFGDMLHLPRSRQEGLAATGINLTHIPRAGSLDQTLILSLMHWVTQNPPPAHLFLICGDKEIASTLHRLRMSNYNILLATPEGAHGVLCSAASIAWNWHEMLRGESLAGKHFNQPPDGPYGSWYGQYKVPLLDPFLSDFVKPCPQPEELPESSSISNTDIKISPSLVVPKGVVEEIRQIVESKPEGMTIAELRNVLFNNNVTINKEYYGFGKFMTFLASLKDVVKLRRVKEGHYIVYSAAQNCDKSKDEDVNALSDPSCNVKPVEENVVQMAKESDEKIVRTPTEEKVVEAAERNEKVVKIEAFPELENLDPPRDEKNVETVNVSETAVVQPESSSEAGFFRRFWRKWVEGESFSSSGGKSSEGKEKSEGKYSEKIPNPLTHLLSSHGPAVENKSTVEAFTEARPASEPGFLDRIQTWFKGTSDADKATLNISDSRTEHFSQDSNTSDSRSELSSEDSNISDSRTEHFSQDSNISDLRSDLFSQDSNISDSRSELFSQDLNTSDSRRELFSQDSIFNDSRSELFSQDSFWSSMESFMDSSEGSLLVSESITREYMANELQKKGPECLRSLGENDLLHLVELLISEKKWVKERSIDVFPFKSTRVRKSSQEWLETHPRTRTAPNTLSSLFTKLPLQSGLKGPPNHDGEEKLQGPHLRSRDDILADCQSLLDEVMREHPNGFFLGLFKKHFLDRYGYPLDFQRLGFRQLAALLNTFPGVVIDSGRIIAGNSFVSQERSLQEQGKVVSHKTASHSSLADFLDELGPVTSTKPSTTSKRSLKSKETQTEFLYEPAISEDESSDPDEAGNASMKKSSVLVTNNNNNNNNNNSSLLQILNSWQSRNKGDTYKNVSSSGGSAAETILGAGAQKRKSKKPKNEISFVADTVKKPKNEINFVADTIKKPKNEISFVADKVKKQPKNEISFVADMVRQPKNEMNIVVNKVSDASDVEKFASGILRNLSTQNETSSTNEKDKVLCQ